MERRVAGLQRLERHWLHPADCHQSQHYVDPATGVHTSKIAAKWLACKSGFKRWYGIARHLLRSYIDEYMAVSHQYPV